MTHFVSKGWVGKTHDYRQLKEEFPSTFSWFSDALVGLDLGYQRFANDYDYQDITQPTKQGFLIKIVSVKFSHLA